MVGKGSSPNASAKVHINSEVAKFFQTFLLKKCKIEKIYMILFAYVGKKSYFCLIQKKRYRTLPEENHWHYAI